MTQDPLFRQQLDGLLDFVGSHFPSERDVNLVKIFGQNVADLLKTTEQQNLAKSIYCRIADASGDDLARAWMLGMNPGLRSRTVPDEDEAPIVAIAEGRGVDAWRAAQRYVVEGY